jgi:hypothetical protein
MRGTLLICCNLHSNTAMKSERLGNLVLCVAVSENSGINLSGYEVVINIED